MSEPATEALPPGQLLQVLAPVLEKVPLGQVEQYVDWLAEAKVPFGHAVHVALPAWENVPRPHATQAEAPLELYLPALQSVHVAAPSLA